MKETNTSNEDLLNLRLLFMRCISSIWNNEKSADHKNQSINDVVYTVLGKSVNNDPASILNAVRQINNMLRTDEG
ncbi:hypothetical protein, partial [Pseudoalteromonas sp. MMG022]|uniref:hypothetical protein n=1 Tax=Pseudoalteromonas sp. MMG022 TaxID=2909978 RepID=UPI001F1D1A76